MQHLIIYSMIQLFRSSEALTALTLYLLSREECPIYTKFDWHKPQLTTVVALLVLWMQILKLSQPKLCWGELNLSLHGNCSPTQVL